VVALFAVSEWFIARKAATTLLYAPNDHYRQDLLPNQVYARDGYVNRIGPHGLRGDEPVLPKPEGVIRIAVMGGSSVFDIRSDVGWPRRLQDILRNRGLGQVEVFNAGIPGFSTREVLPFYERKVAAYQPDVVLLYVGWNDLKYMRGSQEELTLPPWPRLKPGARDPYAFLTAPRPARNWYALQLLLQKLELRAGFMAENTAAPSGAAVAPVPTSTRAEDWAATPGVRYYAGNITAFIEAVRAHGARPVVVAEATLHWPGLPAAEHKRIAYHFVGLSHPSLMAVTEAMVAAERAATEAAGAPWLDPRPGVSGVPANFYDHVHLTPAGSRAVAEAVAGQLLPLLTPGDGT